MRETPGKNKLNALIESLGKLKEVYDSERNENRFNVFYALHKEHDEVNLHSRFISYLLADNSGHQRGNLFTSLFLDIITEKDNAFIKKFLDGYTVIPNEFSKKEFEEIDILLFNKRLKHSIIIENKIYAKDSNHEVKMEGFQGQLERYYNTISKGILKKSINKKFYFKGHDYLSDSIEVYYLTLNRPHKDSFEKSKGGIPENVEVKTIYYRDEIIKWLEECINATKEDEFLNKIIVQYLILVKNMTKTNIPKNELIELRNLFSNNLETTQYLIDNFKHLKWHTVDKFLENLSEQLHKKRYKNVTIYPQDNEDRAKLITELTHYNNDVNLGVTFETVNDEILYISTLNVLSWGVVDAKESADKRWYNFEEEKLQNIRFCDFSTNNTYALIDEENANETIKLIIDEISQEEANDYEI